MQGPLRIPPTICDRFPRIAEMLPEDLRIYGLREQWVMLEDESFHRFEVSYGSREAPTEALKRTKPIWKGAGARRISGNDAIRKAWGDGWHQMLVPCQGGGEWSGHVDCSAEVLRSSVLDLVRSSALLGEIIERGGAEHTDPLGGFRSVALALDLRETEPGARDADGLELWEDAGVTMGGVADIAAFGASLRSIGFLPGEESVWRRGSDSLLLWVSGQGTQLRTMPRPVADDRSVSWAF